MGSQVTSQLTLVNDLGVKMAIVREKMLQHLRFMTKFPIDTFYQLTLAADECARYFRFDNKSQV